MNRPHPISQRSEEKRLNCIEKEGFLPPDGTITSSLGLQPAGLLFAHFRLASSHNCIRQFLKTNLSPSFFYLYHIGSISLENLTRAPPQDKSKENSQDDSKGTSQHDGHADGWLKIEQPRQKENEGLLKGHCQGGKEKWRATLI